MLTDLQYQYIAFIIPILLISFALYTFIYPKLKKHEFAILFLALTIGYSLGSLISAYILLIAFIFIFAYIFKIRKSTPICLITPFLSYIILVVVDNSLTILFFNLFNIDFYTLLHKLVFTIPFFTIYLLYYVIMVYLSNILFTFLCFKKNVTIPKGTIRMLLSNLLLCCVIIVVNIVEGKRVGYNQKNITFNATLFIIFFLVSTITVFQSLRANERAILAQEELKQYENLKNYTDNLEQVYNNLRSFKHDYVNIMSALSSYLDEKRYDELTTFFHTYLVPLKDNLNQSTESLNNLMHIKQLEIKSLLSYKMLYALEKNISVTIDIPEDITYIHLAPVDLTRILGIYLDNAIEAALETEHPEVQLHLTNMNTCVVILISNTFIDKGLTISQMSALNTSSKGEGHGIGLYNVKTILNNYPAIFHETYTKENYFFQHLQIPNA